MEGPEVWGPVERSPAFGALADSLERRAGVRVAAAVRWPFCLPEPGDLRAVLATAGFDGIRVRVVRETTRFPSVAEFLGRYLPGSPVDSAATHISEDDMGKVLAALEIELASWIDASGLSVTTEANIAVASRVQASASLQGPAHGFRTDSARGRNTTRNLTERRAVKQQVGVNVGRRPAGQRIALIALTRRKREVRLLQRPPKNVHVRGGFPAEDGPRLFGRFRTDSAGSRTHTPRPGREARLDQASRRPVPQPGTVTRCSRRAAMIPAIRAASRPTPWICSDDFE